MNKFFYPFSFLLLLPAIVYAETVGGILDGFTGLLGDIILFLTGAAVLVFFWGMVKFISHAGDEKTHDEGKQLMIWSLVALFVMFSLWPILGFFQEALGLDNAPDLGELPSLPNR